jgi:transposase
VTSNETVRPMGQDLVAGQVGGQADPAARPVRRTFTAEYRAQMVAEYEAAPHGQKSAVLRREGLYQSTIREWTQARDALGREASTPTRRHRGNGAGGGKDDPGRLRAENARLTRELAKSQEVVEIMGKLHGLLETLSDCPDTAPASRRR